MEGILLVITHFKITQPWLQHPKTTLWGVFVKPHDAWHSEMARSDETTKNQILLFSFVFSCLGLPAEKSSWFKKKYLNSKYMIQYRLRAQNQTYSEYISSQQSRGFRGWGARLSKPKQSWSDSELPVDFVYCCICCIFKASIERLWHCGVHLHTN